MKISVIISSYATNRYHDLSELLDNIKIQTYRDIETIIIIDENEKLYDKISNIIYKYPNTKAIFNSKNRGLSYSRNVGINFSSGEIIAFIDDDAIPDPRWAETIANVFENNDVGAVTGDIFPLWEKEDMSWFPKELHWMISCSYIMTPNRKCEIERGFGTNMSFRKSLIEQIGRFNHSIGINGNRWIGGEDTDMFLRVRDAGWKVIFDPNAKVLHKVYKYRINLWNVIKRAFNGGISLATMSKVHTYNIKKSNENSYLKKLIFDFYPKGFKTLTSRPKESSKQMMFVSIVILLWGTGYLYEKLHLEKLGRLV